MELNTENVYENGLRMNGHLNEKSPKKFIVKYRNNYYDITEFMHKHPGGINTLKGLENGDMTKRFLKAPPHSDAAMYLMREYLMNPNANSSSNIKKSDKRISDSVPFEESQQTRHVFENGIELIEELDESEDQNNNSINNNNNINKLDESMEHLVDWSKAMLPQIHKITKYYDEWVHKPVDRPLRLFSLWYLEICTKTPWWVVPIFWIPIIFKSLSDEFISSWQAANTSKLMLLTSFFFFGILLWTFLEYTLHRWVFHMKINENTHPWICTFHFTIHGLHHKVPFDPMRLVFPPLPGVVLATILYTPLSFLLPYPRIFLGGALCGYLYYDMMHYYLHYGNPNIQHLYQMKRYHYQHHFAHQDQGFGISSPLWDFVFNTRIHLRKLRYRLRWM